MKSEQLSAVATRSYIRQWGIPALVAVGMLCVTGCKPREASHASASASASASGSAPTFKVDAAWIPQLPADQALGEVASVSVDSKDNVWLLHRMVSLADNVDWVAKNPVGAECCKPAPAVIQMDSSGKILQSWGGAGWDHWPKKESEHGLHVDHDGNVWILWSNTINKYTSNGKFILQLGTSTPSTDGLDPTKFGHPTQFAENPKTNELYISDGYLNRRIIVFDIQTGKFKRMWGAYGKPPNKGLVTAADPYKGADPRRGSVDSPDFNTMHAVAVTNDGFVYGADRVNNRIQVFKEDGTFVKQFAHAPNTLYWGSVWAVAWSPVYPNYLLVGDGMNNHLEVIDREDGKVVSSTGRYGPYAGQFHWLHHLATDSKGNVYTAEVSGGHRVQKFLLQ